jgi:hypothetical protein
MVATAPAVPAVTAISSLTAILVAEAATAGAPRKGLAGEQGVEATAAAEATRKATPPVYHAEASMPAEKSNNYDAKSPPRQATTTASPPSPHSFSIYFFGEIQTTGDHQVRREARSNTVAQMLCPLHRKRWWQ